MGLSPISVLYRSCRIRDKYRLATEFDIVVTTYATLGSDFGGKKNAHRADSPLGGIKWHRIVFDEGERVGGGGDRVARTLGAQGWGRLWQRHKGREGGGRKRSKRRADSHLGGIK
jgi:hypothetical protein